MKNKQISRILFISIFILFVALSCKKESNSEENEQTTNHQNDAIKQNSAVVIFVVGDVRTQDRKLSFGETVTITDIVKTGKKSLCDLQLLESKAGVVIRIKSETEFKIDPSTDPNRADINLSLKSGSSLFKINNKLSKNESIKVATPTMVAGVRGTSFSLDISQKGDAAIQVIEGSVVTRPNIPELDNLPDDVKINSQTVKMIEASLKKNEVTLEAGQKVKISKSYTDKILKDTGLQQALPKALESIQKGDSNSASQILDTISGSKEDTTKKVEQKLAAMQNIKVEKSKDKELAVQLKEFEELIAIEKEKLENESTRKLEITARSKKKEETLIKRIEQITGKSSETLVLKNGSRIQGVIFQEGETYYVLSTEGKQSFPESEVEGTEF